ncbi:MAG: nucleotide exchange factor GrpE [Saprospiraceae bacterium]|jgi:molecular chaperone GrpE|nr:nucleotide exchange factor GrpE [Saprospiraceae bacterium]MDP4821190.1 nucleotide exchange factor GrpE [Saprospiraceae bacterium]MDP4998956.1 nucleotide exchange factor GrpE [Saprospiraceae bacterium]
MHNEEIKDEQPEVTDPMEETTVSDDQGVTELEKQRDELKDKYLRLFAEFDNYKRRTMKERLDIMKTAAQDTIVALLPVLDDFERAKRNAENENSTEVFSEGVHLVYQKLFSILHQQGLEAMDTNGQPFDPELHEALTEIPAPSEELKGVVMDTIEKGYKLKDKIIRHAKVVVGK